RLRRGLFRRHRCEFRHDGLGPPRRDPRYSRRRTIHRGRVSRTHGAGAPRHWRTRRPSAPGHCPQDMTRRLTERRLVVASHNPGKVREIAELLAPFRLEAISAATLGLPEPEETETTFPGNARIKAVAAAKGSGLPALADDSGLCVDALGGEPGV